MHFHGKTSLPVEFQKTGLNICLCLQYDAEKSKRNVSPGMIPPLEGVERLIMLLWYYRIPV
jgi:hypothetical protein